MPVARMGMIGGVEQPVVDARELWAYLEVGKDFSTWLAARVADYNFEENQDFALSPKFGEKGQRGRPSTEYDISTGMAKEVCMLAPQEKGSAARKYFAAVEERAREMVQHEIEVPKSTEVTAGDELDMIELMLKKARKQEARTDALEERVAKLENGASPAKIALPVTEAFPVSERVISNPVHEESRGAKQRFFAELRGRALIDPFESLSQFGLQSAVSSI